MTVDNQKEYILHNRAMLDIINKGFSAFYLGDRILS